MPDSSPKATTESSRSAGGVRGTLDELSKIWRWLRRRLRGREDTEHEQAVIRIAIYTMAFVYMLVVDHPMELAADYLRIATGLYLASVLPAVAIVLHILLRPAISPVRRLVGAAVDCCSLNAFMLLGGEAAMLFFPFLLWTVLGHGFRFGRPYLFFAAGLSLVLFSGVILFSPAWRAIPTLDVALLLALIILPAYFAVLLQKLRHAIEHAEEASRAKSRFLATMSHEFRTPLNAIIGMTDLLRTTRLDHDQRDMAGTVRSAARSLLALVNDLLDAAKIEANQLSIDVEPMDLFRVVATVRAMLQHKAAEKGLYLRIRLDPSTPWQLVGASRQLHQILVNLVANAIKFTDKGGVLIDIRPIDRRPLSCVIRFEVKDTGPGIASEQQDRIFERFTQIEDKHGSHQHPGGTGLGLNIARELTELMGGRMSVTSHLGEGSTFWFELPFAFDEALAETAPSLLGDVVLMGEQEPARAVAGKLRTAGCRTHVVADASSALAALAAAPDRRTIIAVGRTSGADLERLAQELAQDFPAEPIDIVTIGAGLELPATSLADLAIDGDDAVLVSAIRAALAPNALQSSTTEPVGGVIPMAAYPSRILLAEDNRTNQKVISKIVEHAGHKIVVASNGQQAFDLLMAEKFDIALLDINMPQMSGIECVKLLRFSMPIRDIPPLLAVSADATEDRKREAIQAGFTEYLTKPIEGAQLIATLDRVLAGVKGRIEKTQPVSAARPHPKEAKAQTEDGGPWLDRAKLAQLALLDSAGTFVNDLVTDFLAEAEEIIDSMAEASTRGDARGLRDLGHAMRSCAGQIGADALRRRCLGWREIDDHALVMRSPGDIEGLRVDLGRTRTEFQIIRAELAAAPKTLAS